MSYVVYALMAESGPGRRLTFTSSCARTDVRDPSVDYAYRAPNIMIVYRKAIFAPTAVPTANGADADGLRGSHQTSIV